MDNFISSPSEDSSPAEFNKLFKKKGHEIGSGSRNFMQTVSVIKYPFYVSVYMYSSKREVNVC